VNSCFEAGNRAARLSNLFRADVVDIQLCDFSAVENAHCYQIVQQSFIEHKVPEEGDVKELHPAHLEHIGRLGHVDDGL